MGTTRITQIKAEGGKYSDGYNKNDKHKGSGGSSEAKVVTAASIYQNLQQNNIKTENQ